MSCGSLSPGPSVAFQPKPMSSGPDEKDVPCGVFHRSVRFSAPEPHSEKHPVADEATRHSTGPGSLPISIPSVPAGDNPMSRTAPASLPSTSYGAPGTPCRFPKLEECAHFHYERVCLGGLMLTRVLEGDEDYSGEELDQGWVTIRVQTHVSTSSSCDESSAETSLQSQNAMTSSTQSATCAGDGWLLTRNAHNFMTLDEMLHRCIYDRKVSGLPDLGSLLNKDLVTDRSAYVSLIEDYVHHLSIIADDTINCASILNWLHADNKGHRLLVSDEDSSSINTPAVAAAYSVRKYVSQARDEISFEVGDMISVIDMPGPEESTWWRGKRGFNVGFFPQSCVAVIGDKVPRNMSQPPPIVGSVAVTSIKPVLRKHGKLISLFRSFILSRPSRRALKLQGILKERVFGCDLGEHLANSGQDVPLVLTSCATLLESEPAPDGVYRLSGGATLVQRLRTAFDDVSVTSTTILDDPTVRADRHAVASLLKLYFRELPNPLCTYQLYSEFVLSVRAPTPEERLARMRRTVLKLPPPHYRTLSYLMRHLKSMSGQSERTGMCGRNLAIVWAPNLLRTPNLMRAPADRLDLAGLAVQAVVTEYLIVFADEIFSESCDSDYEETGPPGVEGAQDASVELRSSTRRPKTLMLSRSPTKLLSLEEARNRSIKAASISANLLPRTATCELTTKSNQKYIEVGSGPNNLPQYHTVIELPNGSNKRSLKRSPSGWRTFFSRSSQKDLAASSKIRPSIQLMLNSKVEDKPKINDDAPSKESLPLRPVKSYESLGSENDSLPALPQATQLHAIKQHARSASCDSYFEPWQVDLAGMRLRLSPQERDGNIFSEEDDTNRQCISGGSSPETSDPLRSVEPSPSRPDSSLRKRSKYEEQLQFIDADTPRHGPVAPHMDAKRICKGSTQTHSADTSPTNVKLRERTSPRKAKNARYSNTHLQPSNAASDAKIVTLVNKSDRQTWHGVDDNHSTLIKIDWPSESDVSPHYDVLENETDSSDNRQTIKIPEDHSYENVADSCDSSYYQNMLKNHEKNTMTTSYESSTLSNVSPLRASDELYECMNFNRPNYINLSNCTSKSSISSPLKSPLRSTISITFKSPTKISKTGETENEYENVTLSTENVEDASVPKSDATLPTQGACQPSPDVYSQVKFFRKTIDEVNAMVCDKDKPVYENVTFDKPTTNCSVRQLAEKFESPTDPKTPSEKFKFPTLERKKAIAKEETAATKDYDKKQEATCNSEDPISLVQARLTDTETKSVVTILSDRKLSRERIEKYKEERRNFLREKYSSHSFRQSDLKLSRKADADEPVELRVQQPKVEHFERRNTFDLGQRLRFRKAMEGSRSDEENRTSLPNSNLLERHDRTSPSVNIKDMAALFEQRSQNV